MLLVGCRMLCYGGLVENGTENEETENRGNWNLEFRDCGVGTGRVDGTMPVSPIICRDCTVL